MAKKSAFGTQAARRLAPAAALLLSACAYYPDRPVPLTALAPVPAPVPSSEAARLGQALFHDIRLSGGQDLSCASCHQPGRAFEDGRARAIGTGGQKGPLATPTLIGIGQAPRLMANGRVRSLEAQALLPITNPAEMNQRPDRMVALLAGDPQMARRFASAFPDQPVVNTTTIARALAAFQRGIAATPGRLDWFLAGDRAALSAPEQRGLALFTGKARCAQCHSGPYLSDGRMHDIGLTDAGHGTRLRTPTLRAIAQRAPYMHDGRIADLAGVIAHYAGQAPRRRTALPPARLTAADQADLLAFLAVL